MLCYDTRCYNTEAEENIQAVLEEEIPVLERQILPIDGMASRTALLHWALILMIA